MAIFLLGPDPAGTCCDCSARAGPCDSCGEPEPCSCALYVPLGSTPGGAGTPYASLVDAQNAIANKTAGCIVFGYSPAPENLVSISASQPAENQIDCSAKCNVPDQFAPNYIQQYFCIAAKAGSIITAVFTITRTGGTSGAVIEAQMTLLTCSAFGYVDNDVAYTTGTNTFSGSLAVTVPTDGIYILQMIGSCLISETAQTIQAGFSITSSDTTVPNPVIALYDDNGTTRQLEACPKMLLPPLTEATGSWYADCAAVLTDATKVSNCIGYFESFDYSNWTLTATDGGTTMTFTVTYTSVTDGTGYMWASLNGVAGETLTFTATKNATGSPSITVLLYDDTGTLVETISGANPAVSSALPYTGRYIVRIICGSGSGNDPSEWSVVITSSGTMSVNPIQALYDVGLTCPARLNCGNSCP